jgi:ribosomal protein L11 methylase PrmA
MIDLSPSRALVDRWIPTLPDVHRRLLAGGWTLDVGSGGLPAIAIAEAYPETRAWGYDPDEDAIRRARNLAASVGVTARVTLAVLDRPAGEAGPFDLITTLRGVPAAPILAAVRDALADDGTYLAIEVKE